MSVSSLEQHPNNFCPVISCKNIFMSSIDYNYFMLFILDIQVAYVLFLVLIIIWVNIR